jgi:hypothetical protein
VNDELVSNLDNEKPEAEPNGHLTESLAAYALGALDPDESSTVARHLESCAICRAELEGYERVRETLPYAAPVHTVPLRARVELLARIDDLATADSGHVVPRRRHHTQQRSRWAWLPSLPRLAAYSMLPAILVLAVIFVMSDRIHDQQSKLEAMQTEQDKYARILTGISTSTSLGTSYITEFTTTDAAPNAKGRLIVNRLNNSALIVAVGLPQPAEGEQYVVWMQFSGSSEYARGGQLAVSDKDGRASLVVEPFGSVNQYVVVVVTSEPDPNVTTPTGNEVMTAGISPVRKNAE